MIDVKELRIGNYVQDDKGKEIEVDATLFVADMDPNGYFDLSDCLPIPITPEWLERLGFENSTIGDEFIMGSITLRVNKSTEDRMLVCAGQNDGDYGVILETKIIKKSRSKYPPQEAKYYGTPYFKYVHQLQNLYFALIGKELQINPHTP